MAIDISKISHMFGFTLDTEALGPIYCGSITTYQMIDIGASIKDRNNNGPDIARTLLKLIGRHEKIVRKINEEESKDNFLSDMELESISDDEIELFSRKFVETNKWLLSDYGKDNGEIKTNEDGKRVVSAKRNKTNQPKREDELDSDYLVRVLRWHNETQAKSKKK